MNNNIINGGQLSPQEAEMAQMKQILSKATDLVCECGGDIFVSVVQLKKLSRLVAPIPKDVVIPIPLYQCIACKKVVKSL